MAYTQPKEVKIKEKQDKFLRQQLEKEREQQLLEEIERNEKERVKKKGRQLIVSDLQKMFYLICKFRSQNSQAKWNIRQLPVLTDILV